MQSTNVIFKNDKISIKYENDYYSIVANEDLEIGTFIVLEHVISDINIDNIYSYVMKDLRLFDSLYPRKFDIEFINKIFNDFNNKDIDYDIFIQSYKVQIKIMENIFKFNEEHVLCNFISKFNHSCIPNCHMDCADMINNNIFYGIWTHRRIKKDEELTIDYCQSGDINHHDKMKESIKWTCNCTHEYIKNNKRRAKIHMNLGNTFIKSNKKFITLLVDEYMKSDIAKNVISTQLIKMDIIKL